MHSPTGGLQSNVSKDSDHSSMPSGRFPGFLSAPKWSITRTQWTILPFSVVPRNCSHCPKSTQVLSGLESVIFLPPEIRPAGGLPTPGCLGKPSPVVRDQSPIPSIPASKSSSCCPDSGAGHSCCCHLNFQLIQSFQRKAAADICFCLIYSGVGEQLAKSTSPLLMEHVLDYIFRVSKYMK